MATTSALTANTVVGLPLEQAKSFIESADLTPVLERLARVDGWSRTEAKAFVKQYRQFLYLRKKYGSQYKLPPSYEIDEAWHAHILHTRQYSEFCDQLFGHYLHHDPHLAEEADSYAKLQQLFEQTQKLYYQEYGDYIYQAHFTPLRRRVTKLFEYMKRKKS